MSAEIKPTAEVYEQAAHAWALDVNSKMTIPLPPDADLLSATTAHRAEASSFRAAADVAFAAGVAAERARIIGALRQRITEFRYFDAAENVVTALADAIERSEV